MGFDLSIDEIRQRAGQERPARADARRYAVAKQRLLAVTAFAWSGADAC